MSNRRQRVAASEPGRPSLVMGEVMPAKGGAQQWIDAGGLDIYSEPTKVAALRLLDDARVAEYWGKGLGAREFEEAVHCYTLATERDAWEAWDKKTQRERLAWNRQFDKTVSRLIELMAEGPTPPEVWGFPVQDYVLMELLRRIGHPLPSTCESKAFFRKMSEFNAAVEDLPWTIADALLSYQKQVEINSTDAIVMVKKPRDAKAGRAKFIANFRRYSGCSAPVVAAVAGVMFEDVAIDERLVRRLTSGRADS
jgi:hypothetical protein